MTWASAYSFFRTIGIAVVLTALLSGCGSNLGGSDSSQGTPKKKDKNAPPVFKAGTPMASIQKRGKLNVGIVFDRAPFAAENTITGSAEGFDVDLVKWVAQGIFGSNIENKITFIELEVGDRELAVDQGKVDIVVGRYDVSAARKRFVDFAGPYYMTHQAVLTLDGRANKGDDAIVNFLGLGGKKVCTVRGSTNTAALAAIVPSVDLTTQRTTVAECGTDLVQKKVSAIAADAVDVAPFLASSNRTVQVLGANYGDTPYGVGVKKGVEDMRKFVNDRISAWEGYEDSQRTWLNGVPGNTSKPAVDRY